MRYEKVSVGRRGTTMDGRQMRSKHESTDASPRSASDQARLHRHMEISVAAVRCKHTLPLLAYQLRGEETLIRTCIFPTQRWCPACPRIRSQPTCPPRYLRLPSHTSFSLMPSAWLSRRHVLPPGGAAPPRLVTSAEGGWRGKDAHSLHIMWTKPPGDTKSPVTYKVTVCGQMSDDTPKGPREGHDVNGTVEAYEGHDVNNAVEAYKRHEHFTRRARGSSGQDQRCAGLGCGLPQIRCSTLDAG